MTATQSEEAGPLPPSAPGGGATASAAAMARARWASMQRASERTRGGSEEVSRRKADWVRSGEDCGQARRIHLRVTGEDHRLSTHASRRPATVLRASAAASDEQGPCWWARPAAPGTRAPASHSRERTRRAPAPTQVWSRAEIGG